VAAVCAAGVKAARAAGVKWDSESFEVTVQKKSDRKGRSFF